MSTMGFVQANSLIDEAEVFERMCAWDDANFILGAGTKSGSDRNKTDGIVDGHAYSVLTCRDSVAGTEIDLIKVRNPWGRGDGASMGASSRTVSLMTTGRDGKSTHRSRRSSASIRTTPWTTASSG